MILSNEAATVVALWILFSWVHDTAAVHSPILLVTSAEPNSGKTTLLNLIGFLGQRAISTVGVSEAALFRSVERWTPLILVDEADVILVDNEPLRAIVNSGYTRGIGVLRCIGPDVLSEGAGHGWQAAARHDAIARDCHRAQTEAPGR